MAQIRDEPSVEYKQPVETDSSPTDCRKQTRYLDFYRLRVKEVWYLDDALLGVLLNFHRENVFVSSLMVWLKFSELSECLDIKNIQQVVVICCS